jgi:hypothetical protein
LALKKGVIIPTTIEKAISPTSQGAKGEGGLRVATGGFGLVVLVVGSRLIIMAKGGGFLQQQ